VQCLRLLSYRNGQKSTQTRGVRLRTADIQGSEFDASLAYEEERLKVWEHNNLVR